MSTTSGGGGATDRGAGDTEEDGPATGEEAAIAVVELDLGSAAGGWDSGGGALMADLGVDRVNGGGDGGTRPGRNRMRG